MNNVTKEILQVGREERFVWYQANRKELMHQLRQMSLVCQRMYLLLFRTQMLLSRACSAQSPAEAANRKVRDQLGQFYSSKEHVSSGVGIRVLDN